MLFHEHPHYVTVSPARLSIICVLADIWRERPKQPFIIEPPLVQAYLNMRQRQAIALGLMPPTRMRSGIYAQCARHSAARPAEQLRKLGSGSGPWWLRFVAQGTLADGVTPAPSRPDDFNAFLAYCREHGYNPGAGFDERRNEGRYINVITPYGIADAQRFGFSRKWWIETVPFEAQDRASAALAEDDDEKQEN